MVSAAVQIDQFYPAPGKAFEDVDLGRIDHVFNDTGDHRLQASPVAALIGMSDTRDRRVHRLVGAQNVQIRTVLALTSIEPSSAPNGGSP